MIDHRAAIERVHGRAATQVAPAGTILVYRMTLDGGVTSVVGAEAAGVAEHMRPGSVDLVPTPTTVAIRFDRHHRNERRAVTPARLSAARRALARERDAAGLFGEHVAAEQPTPEDRISTHDAGALLWQQEQRDTKARQWRELRTWLRSNFTVDQLAALLTRWRDYECPAHPVMLRACVAKWSKEP